jgi:hypothetical protein
MATATLKPSVSAEPMPIRKQVLDAVKLIVDRAIKSDPDTPNVVDNKEEVKDSTLLSGGPLQDCEFGLILLLVCDWLAEEFFASIDRLAFQKIILSLTDRTVNGVLSRKQNYGGGRGNHAAFFTGEPYTQYARGKKYSANLDAAMITIAFLALAVTRFNDQLVTRDLRIQDKDVKFPDSVKNQRDAVLYVILKGLEYAWDCRVINNSKFAGFTCDPESNAANASDGSLEHEKDRLFFTWTACETINDMIAWRKAYLDQQASFAPPKETILSLKSAIGRLEGVLNEAAAWCQDSFLETFEKFEPEDPKDLVDEVRGLAIDKALDARLASQISKLEISVQHVYHLSQYAAIRSLVPQRVSSQEVNTIIDKLDLLVSTSIIGSRLDESSHPELFRTLTRQYSLGKSNPDPYTDDAWYPLVVRSLAGLLTRTLDEIDKRFSESEVLSLTLTFQRALKGHVKNLLDRRPKGGKEGPDGKLWSFAGGQPYVLYATQRTIFALMKYEEFLSAVDSFLARRKKSDDGKTDDLPTLMARKLSENYFLPVIRDLLSHMPPLSPTMGAISSNGQPGQDLSLPEESWAARVVRDWLTRFTDDFKKSQVAAMLRQRAQSLKLIKKYAEGYQPSENLPQRKKDNARGQLQELKGQYERICRFGSVGQKLSQLAVWEDEDLIAILFEHVFQEYIQRSIGDFLRSDSIELWKLIHDAKDRQDNISNIDGAATVL